MAGSSMVKCRLCLVETEIYKMYELFKTNEIQAFKTEADQKDEFSNLKLNEKVEYCCGVRVHNKNKLPTRMCGKCFNMIHMWFNFRQMCYNSQVFLTSQLKEDIDIEEELGNIKTVRSKIKSSVTTTATATVKSPEKYYDEEDDFQELVNFELQDDDDEHLDSYFNDTDAGDDIVNDNNNDYAGTEDEYDSEVENAKLETMAEFYTDHGDLLESLTPEDYNEAMAYLNFENDHTMEELIEHCATKNIAIRQLKAKAMTRYKSNAAKKLSRLEREIKKEKDIKKEKLPKPSTFMCNICGNVYSKKPLFQHHMRMHSDVKPYQCEICNKSYRIMSDLRNHMYRHTGEKPFKCKHCDRHFMDRSSRHRHERVHTNSRPYKCDICNKSFTYSAILKNHLKLHSGEKDYVCSICNKQFTLAHQLKAHMLTISHKQKEAAYEASGYKIVYEGSNV